MTRKDAILKAATELFVENGYDATSTAKIAERAGVAQGTIFHHFGKKKNILLQIAEITALEFYAAVDSLDIDELNGLEALKAHMLEFFKLLDRHWNNIYVLMQEMPQILSYSNESPPECVAKYIGGAMAKRRALIEKGIIDGSIMKCDPDKMLYLTEALFSGIAHLRITNFLETPEQKVKG
jgi:AcrR family transcriptional regulator